MTEIIRVRPTTDGPWHPVIGDEVNGLLIHKGFSNPTTGLSESGERILDETCRIMAKCGNPVSAANLETGLVIGYVQSGKTLSFTSLTALARDNNFKIVI